MKIVSVFSYRGNVGKTTLASGLAIKLYERGYNIGLLDFDLLTPGGLAMLFNYINIDLGVVDLLLDDIPLSSILIDISFRTQKNKLYLIPAVLDIEKIIRVIREGCPFWKLKKIFDALRNELDLLIVDTHAGFVEDTITMLTLSDLIVLILKYDLQDIVGTRIATSILKKMRIPLLSLVNMAPLDCRQSELLDHIEGSIGIRPIMAIPTYQELTEHMLKGSIIDFINNHAKFASDIEKLATAVEVKINNG